MDLVPHVEAPRRVAHGRHLPRELPAEHEGEAVGEGLAQVAFADLPVHGVQPCGRVKNWRSVVAAVSIGFLLCTAYNMTRHKAHATCTESHRGGRDLALTCGRHAHQHLALPRLRHGPVVRQLHLLVAPEAFDVGCAAVAVGAVLLAVHHPWVMGCGVCVGDDGEIRMVGRVKRLEAALRSTIQGDQLEDENKGSVNRVESIVLCFVQVCFLHATDQLDRDG